MTKVSVYKSNLKCVFGCVFPNEAHKLPLKINGNSASWKYWKDIDIEENTLLIGENPKKILADISSNGFHVCKITVNITVCQS